MTKVTIEPYHRASAQEIEISADADMSAASVRGARQLGTSLHVTDLGTVRPTIRDFSEHLHVSIDCLAEKGCVISIIGRGGKNLYELAMLPGDNGNLLFRATVMKDEPIVAFIRSTDPVRITRDQFTEVPKRLRPVKKDLKRKSANRSKKK